MAAILGIAGRRCEASVAMRVDDGLAAAAREDSFVRVAGIGYAQTGGFPVFSAEACLTRAGLAASDVTGLAVVDDGCEAGALLGDGVCGAHPWLTDLASIPVTMVDPVYADAVQAAVSAGGADVVLVLGIQPPRIAIYTRRATELRPFGRGADCGPLMSAARLLCRALGGSNGDPFRSLEQVGSEGEAEFAESFREAVRWRAPMNLAVDEQQLMTLVETLSADLPGGLADSSTMNVRTENCRRALAASFMATTARLVREAVEHASDATGSTAIILGGGLFDNPRLNTRIRDLVGDLVSFAAIPGPGGRAIGASLANAALPETGLRGLALGPCYSEDDIKTTLENCRLDYVYEPDWRRLLLRVSKMLSRGMVIGWFHGPTGFGPRSLGTRSVLCDPSTPYARENLNVFLRQVPLAEPLPVSMSPSVAATSLRGAVRSPFMLFDAPVQDSIRPRLRAALNNRDCVQIHTVTGDQAPELCELLAVHNDRTHVPGLINVNLSGPGEPTACTPRDAVRTMFASAIDALVIGRFLLMKDYWLLRSDVD